MRITLSSFIIIFMIVFISNDAFAKYTCNVEIRLSYSTTNSNGNQAYHGKILFNESFSSSGIARFDGGTPSRTQKCMNTAWDQTFPNSLNETTSISLLNGLNLDSRSKEFYCDGGSMDTPWNWTDPANWANSKKYVIISMKAKKLIGNGYRETSSPAWIPKKWCADFEAAQAAAQAEQDAAQAAADAEQAEQDAYNAACLTCLYTWDKKYHSCAIKMGFKYSSTANISLAGSIGETAADAISEAQCKQRSNYIRRHKPDTSTLPYDVTIPPIKPVSGGSSVKSKTILRKKTKEKSKSQTKR